MISVEKYQQLLNCLLEDDALTTLLNITSELLGNPVMLVDTNYNLLGYTENWSIEDEAWMDLLNNGFSTPEYVRRFSDEMITEKCLASEDPILVTTGLADKVHRAIVQIRLNQNTVAFFAVFEVNEKLTEDRIKDFGYLAKVIGCCLFKNPEIGIFSVSLVENVLIDVLNEKIRSASLLEQRLAAAKWSMWGSFTLYTILPPHPVLHEYYSGIFRERFPDIQVVSFQNNVLLFVEDPGQYDKEKILSVCRKNHLRIARSLPFYNLFQSRKAYDQCKIALSYGKKRDDIIYYGDILPFHMASQEMGDSDVRSYLYPGMQKLIHYDEEHKTDYMEMLRFYLEEGCSNKKTAKVFSLHRNSVLKRIEKIKDITGWDLENSDEKRAILRSFIFYDVDMMRKL